MPRFSPRIDGGWVRHPRWFADVAATMAPTSERVWMALLVRYNLPGHPDIVTIGVRSLATAVDHSVGAVRNAIEDLERRGLITPADPGPYGRARWTMAIEQKPEHAKAKPTTRRGEHARRQVREISGRFGPIG